MNSLNYKILLALVIIISIISLSLVDETFEKTVKRSEKINKRQVYTHLSITIFSSIYLIDKSISIYCNQFSKVL